MVWIFYNFVVNRSFFRIGPTKLCKLNAKFCYHENLRFFFSFLLEFRNRKKKQSGNRVQALSRNLCVIYLDLVYLVVFREIVVQNLNCGFLEMFHSS